MPRRVGRISGMVSTAVGRRIEVVPGAIPTTSRRGDGMASRHETSEGIKRSSTSSGTTAPVSTATRACLRDLDARVR